MGTLTRRVAMLTLASVMLLAAAPVLPNDSFPSKPVRIIVPYPTGGGADLFARAMAPRLGELLSQPVVVENRAGANGIIGTDAVAKSPPDGYTLVMGNIGPNAINQALYPELPYDCVTGFAPIIRTGYTTHLLAASTKLPVNSVRELIDLARKQPGKLTFASSGIGGSPHLAGELFNLMAGTKMVHVPYKGASPGNTDLVGGQVDVTFNTLPPLLSYVKTKRIKALAVTGGNRSASLPEVPTIGEAALPGYDVTTWYGILAPAGTSRSVVARLNAAFTETLRTPAVRESLTVQGFDVDPSTPEVFGRLIKEEVQRWKEVVKNADVKAN